MKRKALFRTTATMQNAELYAHGQPQTEAERRLIQQYRHLSEAHNRHDRPFTIVFVINGEDITVYSGAPSGRIDK